MKVVELKLLDRSNIYDTSVHITGFIIDELGLFYAIIDPLNFPLFSFIF